MLSPAELERLLDEAVAEREAAVDGRAWWHARARENRLRAMLQEAIAWQEGLHPRGRGGKWIAKLGSRIAPRTTVGVTPYHQRLDSQKRTTFAQAAELHRDPAWAHLFRGFEHEIERIAAMHNVKVTRGERNVGVFEGFYEPSYGLAVKGKKADIDAFAKDLGGSFEQDAVVEFTPRADGPAVELQLEGGKDPDAFYKALTEEMGGEAGAAFDAGVWRVFVGEDADLAERVVKRAQSLGMKASMVRGDSDYFDTKGHTPSPKLRMFKNDRQMAALDRRNLRRLEKRRAKQRRVVTEASWLPSLHPRNRLGQFRVVPGSGIAQGAWQVENVRTRGRSLPMKHEDAVARAAELNAREMPSSVVDPMRHAGELGRLAVDASSIPDIPYFNTPNPDAKHANIAAAKQMREAALKGDVDGVKAVPVHPKAAKLKGYQDLLVGILTGEVSPESIEVKQPKPKPHVVEPPSEEITALEAKLKEKHGIEVVDSDSSNAHGNAGWLALMQVVDAEAERLNGMYPGITNGVRLSRARPSGMGVLGAYNPTDPATGRITLKTAGGIGGSGKNKYGMPFNVGTGAADVFRHELGHWLDYHSHARCRDALKQTDFRDENDEPLNTTRWAKRHVSEYAGSMTSESIAETWCLYASPDYKPGTLPPRVEAIVEALATGEMPPPPEREVPEAKLGDKDLHWKPEPWLHPEAA